MNGLEKKEENLPISHKNKYKEIYKDKPTLLSAIFLKKTGRLNKQNISNLFAKLISSGDKKQDTTSPQELLNIISSDSSAEIKAYADKLFNNLLIIKKKTGKVNKKVFYFFAIFVIMLVVFYLVIK